MTTENRKTPSKRRMRRKPRITMKGEILRKPRSRRRPCIVEIFWPNESFSPAMVEAVDLNTTYGRVRFYEAHWAYNCV